jgi:periplasmic copper chaperone A
MTVATTACTLLLGLFTMTTGTQAATIAPATAGDITVDGAWARPTVGQSKQGVIYLSITNAGTEADRLTGASTPAAASAELHTVAIEGGMMKMRAVEAITIPPGETVTLAPGGDHIMLMSLVAPLRKGSSIALTLSFETAGDLDLPVPVQDAPPAPMAQ